MKSWIQKLNGSEFKVMRLNDAPNNNQVQDCPEKIVEYLRANISSSLRYSPDTENFIVILLSARKKPIGFEVVSNGTLDTLIVHPREVFKPAIILGASSIVIAHNHPSGDPTPSEADIKVTRDLIRAGQLLKIEVVDHIIIGNTPEIKPWVSLRELGYFYQ